MIANSELKVAHHIDRSHFVTALLLRFTPIFPLPDEGLDCLTSNDVSRREIGLSIDVVKWTRMKSEISKYTYVKYFFIFYPRR